MKTRPTHPLNHAFTLLEIIGVLAVLSILAGVMLPNVIRKIAAAHANREEQNLAALAQGLKDHVASRQSIPGAATWVESISQTTGLNLQEIRYVTPANSNSARIFLVHPGFTPSNGEDPVFKTVSQGTIAPTNARILIISSTRPNLALPARSGKAPDTPETRLAFEAIWNWNFDPSTKAPPAEWPAEWNHNGEYLHLRRINLAPLFHHVTFNNTHFPTNIPFARFNNLTPIACNLSRAVDAYYLQGTLVRLYRHDAPFVGLPLDPNDLDLVHTVEQDVNFLYDGATFHWRIP